MGVALVGVATGKVRYATSLLSGTTYTVPAGVTSLNVTLFGGGGGGTNTTLSGSNLYHVAGVQGQPGQVVSSIVSCSPGASIAYAIGAGGSTAAQGGTTTFTGATSASGGLGGSTGTQAARQNNGGSGAAGTSSSVAGTGATGGAGMIEIEYWV